MSLAMSQSYNRIPSFKHAPLDHTRPSIRIMKVLPNLSREGFLQCILIHGSTDDDYTCLSYTWGDESTICPTLMDGQLFFVRQNLYNFLHVVRKKYPLKSFWIDAVCINQSSNAERNHQVAQMGTIYSAAAHVIIWLGNNSKISQYFHVWNQFSQQGRKYVKRNKLVGEFMRTQDGWVELAYHAYWTRAWITQEIAHSRTLSLLAEGVEVHNLEDIDMFPLAPTPRKADERFVTHIALARHHNVVKGALLSSLLQSLPYQECQNARDRVYSLLGLAAGGADVCVDYGSSDVEFVLALLKACGDMVCLCGLKLIFNILGGIQMSPADLPAESYSFRVRVTRPLDYGKPILLGRPFRTMGALQNYSPLPNRKDGVYNIHTTSICGLEDSSSQLEVFGCGEHERRQQIGRFVRSFDAITPSPPRFASECQCLDGFVTTCACAKPWWPGLDRHSRRGVYYDREQGSWQPVTGATHQKTLIWYRDPSSKRIVSNWFRVGFQEQQEFNIVDVPLQFLLMYALQSTTFHDLDAYFGSEQSTESQSLRLKQSVNMCTFHELTGHVSLQEQTVFKDVWLHEDLNGFSPEKEPADTL